MPYSICSIRVIIAFLLTLLCSANADSFWDEAHVRWDLNYDKVKGFMAEYHTTTEVLGTKTVQSGRFWQLQGKRCFSRFDLATQSGNQAFSTKMLQRGDSVWISTNKGPLNLSESNRSPNIAAWGPFVEPTEIFRNPNAVFVQETAGLREYRLQKEMKGIMLTFLVELDVASHRLVCFKMEQNDVLVKKAYGYQVLSGIDVLTSIETTVAGGKAAAFRQVDSWSNIQVNTAIFPETFMVEP